MKNTDKITMTVGQLKKLIKEDYESIYNDTRWIWIVTYREEDLTLGYPFEAKIVINAKDKSEAKNKFNLYAEKYAKSEKKYLEYVKSEQIQYID